MLDRCACGGSAGLGSGDHLPSDRGLLAGLLSTVPDCLQCFGSQMLLCPMEFITKASGSLSDSRLLSELFMRQSSLQSL